MTHRSFENSLFLNCQNSDFGILKSLSLVGLGNWEFGNLPGNAPRENGREPGNQIWQSSGTGGNRENDLEINRERAGIGNKIFKKFGNGREPGT